MTPKVPPVIDRAGAMAINLLKQEAKAQGLGQNEEVDELSPKQRARMRLVGYLLLSIGFIFFMTAPVLWVLLAPDGNPVLAAAFAIIAMAILMLGGLVMGLGHMKKLPPRGAQAMSVPRNRQEMLSVAENLVAAERLEEAAQIYEQLGMFQEAGDLRRRAKAQVITHVNVDMDQLIEELRKGGLVTSYNCPNCGAAAKITGSTSSAALTHCTFCGAAFKTTDIVDLLAQVAGYR